MCGFVICGGRGARGEVRRELVHGDASLCARYAPRSGGVFEGDEPSVQFGEKPRREKSVSDRAVVIVADPAQIRARPAKAIALGQHYPRRFGVKAQQSFDGQRDFKRDNPFIRQAMRDRQHSDVRVIVNLLWREHDGAGAILDAFLATLLMLPQPQIRTPNNEAWLRLG